MPTGVYSIDYLPETFKNVEFRDQTALYAGILRGTRA